MECGGTWYVHYPKRSLEFKIWGLGCIHRNNVGCDKDLLQRTIRAIQDDPLALWLGLGDYADYIGPSDLKRFDPMTISPDLRVCDFGDLGKRSAELVVEMLDPIREKCLGLVLGNHELKYQQRHAQQGLHGWVCTELGVPDLGYSAFLDVVFRREARSKIALTREKKHSDCQMRRYRIFCHHGAGAASTPAGKLTRLCQFMRDFEADLYLVGHGHDKMHRWKIRQGADRWCERLQEHLCLGVSTGSFLRTYVQGATGYGEPKAYEPLRRGAVWVGVKPDDNEFRYEDRGECHAL